MHRSRFIGQSTFQPIGVSRLRPLFNHVRRVRLTIRSIPHLREFSSSQGGSLMYNVSECPVANYGKADCFVLLNVDANHPKLKPRSFKQYWTCCGKCQRNNIDWELLWGHELHLLIKYWWMTNNHKLSQPSKTTKTKTQIFKLKNLFKILFFVIFPPLITLFHIISHHINNPNPGIRYNILKLDNMFSESPSIQFWLVWCVESDAFFLLHT